MPDRDEERTHYLRPFKTKLDEVFGPAPLHICLEAAHPMTLGRSSDLIMRMIQNECFEDDANGDDRIETHFISDRLSVPTMKGHILVIGGPRSNVIARIGMEYEATLGAKSQHYARHTNHTFKMDYAHIDRDDYGGRLFADMDSLDKDAQSIIYHYFKLLQRPPFKDEDGDTKVKLYSANRYLRWRNDSKYPSLSARIEKGLKVDGEKIDPQSNFTIYDHYIETVLPNVLNDHWQKHGLIIYHGLRALGTYAALQRLSDEAFLKGLEKRLKRIKKRSGKKKRYPSALQTGWKVVRALEPRMGKKDKLLSKLIKTHGYEDVAPYSKTERIIYRRHKTNKKDEETNIETVSSNAIKAFRREIKNRKFIGVGGRDMHTVKLDEINAQQILDAMSLQRDKFFRRHNIYVLGCFENKKTVYTQQSRALTLIHALFKAGKIKPNTKIGIVGGGVSGMAAAIAAAETGARVVLMERSDELAPVQRNCSHRSLNPFSYDWPKSGSDRTRTNFPIDELNWETSKTAATIFQGLSKKFKQYRKRINSHGDRQSLTIHKNFNVCGYYFDRVNGKHILSKEPFPDKPINLQEKPIRDEAQEEGDWEEQQREWRQALAAHNGDTVRTARIAGTDNIPKADKGDFADQMVDCDIVIFATGYGKESASSSLEKDGVELPEDFLINESYWEDDRKGFKKPSKNGSTFIVSGSGDGALIDILRLCIKEFRNEKWHAQFIEQMNELTRSDMSGAIWSNRREILVFAHALADLFESDEFKLIEGEEERIAQIERTLAGFDIDAFLDAMAIELNDVTIQNVSRDPQPFWADSATAHRLLVWCLYKKGKVRFIRGSIVGGEKVAGRGGKPDVKKVKIERRLLSKKRAFEVEGVVIRHGVPGQNAKFLEIPGLLYNYNKEPGEIARDGQRLVSLLRLSNDLHPETEKFFRHTIRNLRGARRKAKKAKKSKKSAKDNR